jgi:HK97 gp10 family phage protein
MAQISTSGLEELLGDMGAIAEIPDATILEMLTAEAEVIAAAQEAEARSMLAGDYSTGETAQSVTYDKVLKATSDGKALYVYPKGTRKHGNRRQAAEVAFVNEFGKNGQPGRPFIRTANEKKAEEAANAAADVYDRFLKSKNL